MTKSEGSTGASRLTSVNESVALTRMLPQASSIRVERKVGMGRRRKKDSPKQRETFLWVIAVFKLFKGLLLLSVGIGALSLIHKNVADVAAEWANALSVDPGNHYIHKLLIKFQLLNDRKLEEISAGTFFYAALVLTEGGGLLRRKPWAEYLTIFLTVSFIPLEVYELIVHFSFTKIVVVLINIAVVLYLVARLRADKKWPFGAGMKGKKSKAQR